MSTECRYELLSLPGWTRAESLKMLFHLAEKPFLDRRISINEWKSYKHKMALPPDLRLPVMRVNNKNYSITGTLEIGRFLARQFNLFGESTIDQAQIEEILGYVETVHTSFLPVIRATLLKNDELRVFHQTEFKDNVLDPILQFLVRRLGHNDYLVSNKITFADIAIVEMLAKFSTLADFLNPYPTLQAYRHRIESMPQLKDYLSQRSSTIF